MSYGYGSPYDTAAGLTRPRCFSDDRVYFVGAANERACRSCSFQMSCRDEILRMKNQASARVPVSSYTNQGYGPVPIPQQNSQFTQMQMPQQAPQPLRQPAPAQQVTQYPQSVPQAMIGPYPAPESYQYGWLVDPLYYTMAASPPPPVPTLEGERSHTRFGKNIGRSFLLALTQECYLAARQFVWAPRRNRNEEDPSDGL